MRNSPSLASMSEASVRQWRLLGAGTAVLAGLFHLVGGVNGFADPTSTGNIFGQEAVWVVPGFFLVLGSFQLIWTWATLKEHEVMIGLGTVAFLASIVLYLVAVVTPLPLGVKQQSITPVAVIVKIIEVVYVTVSIALIMGLSRKTVVN